MLISLRIILVCTATYNFGNDDLTNVYDTDIKLLINLEAYKFKFKIVCLFMMGIQMSECQCNVTYNA